MILETVTVVQAELPLNADTLIGLAQEAVDIAEDYKQRGLDKVASAFQDLATSSLATAGALATEEANIRKSGKRRT